LLQSIKASEKIKVGVTHIFIVNDITFKYHLEHMFAGTGSGERIPSFLTNANVDMHHSTERNLVGMIADISKIRRDDNVIFYLTKRAKFYGIFKVEQIAFADVNGQYLSSELNKNLSFRVLLKPCDVFAKGITEHECLDCLDGIDAPYKMCWSLIYRKLKGERGCTTIFDYEADRIKNLIKTKNENNPLQGTSFTYNNTDDIIETTHNPKTYTGQSQSISIKNRVLIKANLGNSFEVHLQAYLMQSFASVANLIGITINNYWISNEVSCGVGMQKIDIMLIEEIDANVTIYILELKAWNPTSDIINYQLPWYVKWCSDYVVPNFQGKNVIIKPIVVGREFSNANELQNFNDVCEQSSLGENVETISFVSFSYDAQNITFKKEF